MSDHVNAWSNQPQYEIETVRLPNGDIAHKVTTTMPEWLQTLVDNSTDEELDIIRRYVEKSIAKAMTERIYSLVESAMLDGLEVEPKPSPEIYENDGYGEYGKDFVFLDMEWK